MLTPALRAKKYGELSHEEYALWYASQIGVTEGDIVAAGKKRSLGLIEDAVADFCLQWSRKRSLMR